MTENLFAGLGLRIRERRKELRMTVPQLAERLSATVWVGGVTRSYVSNLETADGERLPSAPVLMALADVLGVTTDWILGREMAAAPEPEPEPAPLPVAPVEAPVVDLRVRHAAERIVGRVKRMALDDIMLVDILTERLAGNG